MKTVSAIFAAFLLTASVFGAEIPVGASATAGICKVNVNAATSAELQYLIRTGPVLAERIIAARPLDAAKLDAVKGVGERWLAVNGPHVTFSGETTCDGKLKAPKVEQGGSER